MKDLIIEGSHGIYFKPTVNFNVKTGICEISGESYLEKAPQFYQPLLDWLNNYMKMKRAPIAFNFRLTYFNSSSSKSFLDILNLLKAYKDKGGKVDVNWYYDVEEMDVEDIEDYMEDTGMHINMLPM